MSGSFSYLTLLAICGFLSAVWVSSRVSKVAGVSPVALEIATGVVLGPGVLGLITKEYAVCAARQVRDCAAPPDLAERVREGLPLGASLGRIAALGHCDPRDYLPPPRSPRTTTTTTQPPDDSKAYLLTGVDDENQAGRPSPYRGQLEVRGGSRKKPFDPAADFHHPGAAREEADDGNDPPEHNEHTTTTRPAHSGSEGDRTTRRPPHAYHTGTPGAADPEIEGGHHRRLVAATGASKYSSYEECLVQECEADLVAECSEAPDPFTLIGQAGVALMLFESGLHFDFVAASTLGSQVCAVAAVGTLLPFATGVLLALIYGVPLAAAAAVGAALAPTSIGSALRLLGDAGVLHHDFAQSIVASAHLGDMLSLVLFTMAYSLKDGYDVMTTVCNPLIGIAFMGVAFTLAVQLWPVAVRLLLPVVAHTERAAQETLFLMMMALLFIYAMLTHLLGTHLLGCFVAGVSFSCLDLGWARGQTLHIWTKQTKRVTTWMVRIFFACTVAFALPVAEFLTFEAFWKGSLLGLGPGILAKVLCAVLTGPARFVVGWAMVGRAEFAYLIAQMAAAVGLIDGKTYSICIWALLYATLSAPLALRLVLHRHIEDEGIEVRRPPPPEEAECADEQQQQEVEAKAEFGRAPEFARSVSCGKPQGDLERAMRKDTDPRSEHGRSPGCAGSPGGGSTAGSARQMRPWWGFQRKPRPPSQGNGLVCCLFFKKLSQPMG